MRTGWHLIYRWSLFSLLSVLYILRGKKRQLRKQPLVFGPSRLPLRGSLYKIPSTHRQVMPQPLRQCGPSVTGWDSQGCGAGCLAALTSGNTSALPVRSPAVSLGTSTQATALHRTHHYMPFFQSQEALLHLGHSLFQPSPLLFHPRTTQLSSLLTKEPWWGWTAAI